ncbi:MAG: WecB/TagA/CpsF family glycosyltransferase [Leptolyngbyaceae cyanobacterium SM1_1_3]|nr:WecB/TagA/CpsF family glycosyltransferase [Leptolyngbyaceae cyanobacterium SM1_1_3]NJM84889.1 WecB/TagA/CpsF family glycosyltransferase [Leptolyngbyaceae cyanobacterium RM2_2_21]NJN04222.1 WecB/TagA/CpsF family glycosyltransferase [Leptolyngbyaceae cyanobacterium RM1_1_2]NJO11698.1 WecB/TagA/CpsF family glycosyltransferase [Leptolyngbyaceae cyanobacterium SL_1_1]
MGLPVHRSQNYVGWLLSNLRQGMGAHIVTLNAEMSMQADRNPDLRKIIQSADLVIPDGSGIVLYFRLQGKRIQRCPGIELAAELLQQAQAGESVFFYGGAPGVADSAMQVWQQRLPNLAIAGVQHGYLTAQQQPALRQRLKTLQPKLIFVGLGVPRQEFWIAQHRHLCSRAIWVGVGGSFDIWSGTKARAPAWFCNNHLEWLYRLYQEPWRWRRMLSLPHFAWRAFTYNRP